MSQNKSICETKPTFLLGKRNARGGLTLGVPLVYSGLMADHTLHTSDGSSHPSQLVVSDYKTGSPSSLVTGENAPLISQNPEFNGSTGEGGKSKAGMNTKLNPDKVKLLKSKYPSIRNSSRLNKFFIQSFSKSGTAPSVAQYSKMMKAIQSNRSGAGKKFQGSPLEYKRILDYFQFTLVQTLNRSNGKLFLYRPNIHKIHENLVSFSNYKEAIMASYVSQNENDFFLYNKACFATKDRPAGLASVVRGIKTAFKRPKDTNAYTFSDNASTNIDKLKRKIKLDLEEFGINPDDYINRNYNTPNGKIRYFLNYRKFLELSSRWGSGPRPVIVLFYWMFNYPGDNNGILLQKFISIIDTFHDFTGNRATGYKSTQGGFNGIWPSGGNAQQKSQKINFDGLSANMVLQGNSAFLVQILGRNIYRLAKDNGAARVVAGKNERQKPGLNSMKKLSHLLYFFANLMGGTKDLTGKCEAYASELLVKTGTVKKPSEFCTFLNEGGKHALVIDIFSTDGTPCIKERSVLHGVGFMDPARRSAVAWGKILANCTGRGTKGLPTMFELDNADENRISKIDQELQRQFNNIYKTKGNKRTRNNNNNANTKKPNVKRRPFTKVINPPLTTAPTSFARAMNAINRKSVGDKRTRNNNNNAKTVKRVKSAARTNVINLTKNNNNNNNKSLDRLVKNDMTYAQQISNTTEQLGRPHLVKNPAKFPTTIANLRKRLLKLKILKAEGVAAYYKKRAQTGDKTKEINAEKYAAILKNKLK